jgi:hypothetical protein
LGAKQKDAERQAKEIVDFEKKLAKVTITFS